MAKQNQTMYAHGLPYVMGPGTVYAIFADGEKHDYIIQADGTSRELTAEEYKTIMQQIQKESH